MTCNNFYKSILVLFSTSNILAVETGLPTNESLKLWIWLYNNH